MKRWSFVLVLLLAVPLLAQTPGDVATRVTINSKILGEERTMWLRLPDGYGRTEARYPTLYLTDGDAQMLHTVSTVAFLERQGRIPAMIVVGVNNTDRTRDLTPSAAPMQRPDGTRVDLPNAGGAGNFLSFFENELIPWVESNYRTQPFRIFFGHSFGGLFAVNALATKPDLFHGVIAASPSLQWDGDLAIRKTAGLFESRKSLPVTVHVTAGREADNLVSSVKRFETLARRKAPKDFRISTAYHDDEDHGSITLRTLYDGLRSIFADWQPPRDENGQMRVSLRQILDHYSALSGRLGYSILPPEAIVNQIGYQYLAAERFDEAIGAFRMNLENYPESANVYDSLGEAHERRGELDAARKLYALAVEKSEGKNDPNEAAFRANLGRVSK
ncbi:MAG: alpha/beta hydrolase-fold protein [Thermoanaerobaculia bacterium]